MCKFSSKSGGVPFQPLGDLTWNDPIVDTYIDGHELQPVRIFFIIVNRKVIPFVDGAYRILKCLKRIVL